jgi:hypothetical protein
MQAQNLATRLDKEITQRLFAFLRRRTPGSVALIKSNPTVTHPFLFVVYR